YSAWRKAFGQSVKEKKIQEDCNEFWRDHRDKPDLVTQKLKELNQKINTQTNIYSFFEKVKLKGKDNSSDVSSTYSENPGVPSTVSNSLATSDASIMDCTESEQLEPDRECPAHLAATDKLARTNEKIDCLIQLKNVGIGLTSDQDKLLKTLIKKKQELKKKLHILEVGRKSSKKYREKKRKQMEKLKLNYPRLIPELREISSDKVGRPRLETSQPTLLQTIVKLVSPTGAAEDRRRSEKLRSCQTLDEILEQLNKKAYALKRILIKFIFSGFQLSRSSLYLRLLPRDSLTIEGKRHVQTVPVRLIRAQNNFRKKHVDFHFTAATMMWLKQIGEIIGDQSVCVISQDDKSRVPLGLAAASKQAPILMHMEYQVSLPDHDWVVASRHKLIPSVYAGMSFNSQGKMTYSGPIYIAVRSGKHDSSTAKSHAADIRQLFELPAFASLVKRKDLTVKPIVIILSDGGPDENPRYPKTL
ncbi:unnamed protein product, partial [Allacma fusca]